jgi:alpha-glucosidase
MALQADAGNVFRERLGHSHPASYPYVLRYKEENARRLAVPAAIEGAITIPWRVVMAGRDLDTLVHSDAVHNLAPPPDTTLFPEGTATSWVRPGRAVWRYRNAKSWSTYNTTMPFTRMLAGHADYTPVVFGERAYALTPCLRGVRVQGIHR